MTERQASYNAGETETIKPCPYCGEPNNISVVRNPDYFVRCHLCGAAGPLASNEADAIMLHNAAASALEAAKTERDEARTIARKLYGKLEHAKKIINLYAPNYIVGER